MVGGTAQYAELGILNLASNWDMKKQKEYNLASKIIFGK